MEYNWPITLGRFAIVWSYYRSKTQLPLDHHQHLDPVCLKVVVFMVTFRSKYNYTYNVIFLKQGEHRGNLFNKYQSQSRKMVAMYRGYVLNIHFYYRTHPSLINKFGAIHHEYISLMLPHWMKCLMHWCLIMGNGTMIRSILWAIITSTI